MKHPIIKPNGETYASVWVERGMLCIHIRRNSPPHPIVHLDEKVIPQLMAALAAIQAQQPKGSAS